MLFWLAVLSAAAYLTAVVLLAVYGLHSLWLLRLYLRARPAELAATAREAATTLADADLPTVLVQLPVYNERDVVLRLVEAVGLLDWPADRLRIQLLDDSTDDSISTGESAIAALRARGLNAVCLHRTDRAGYKAGALAAGMDADGPDFSPYIAIFDADFVPTPDFLRRALVPLIADPGLALVQGRWEHLNRQANVLTRAQALGIDGHFAIEQGARAGNGLALNFNGTCGVWRRTAIIAGGGWEHDTLTEDMDLSYRVQLAGWRCTYRSQLAVPGEIPATVSAWRAQQFRWAKGSIQTAMKLLPRVWRSPWSIRAKMAATLHMTHYAVHPLMLLSLLSAPLALLLLDHRLPWWILVPGCVGFLVGAACPFLLNGSSQFILHGRQGLRALRDLPILASLGTGIAVSNSLAVWQAVRGKASEFVRTPKQGSGKGSYRAVPATGMAELACAAWAALGIGVGVAGHYPWVTPILVLYCSGFLWVALYCMRERAADRAAAAAADGGERPPGPMPWLLPLGLALVALYAVIGFLPGSWRSSPVAFGGTALAASAVYLAAVWAVRRRPGGGIATAWVVVIAIAIRLACLPLAPSDDVNRYLLEGRQVAVGQNPFMIGPHDAQARALVPSPVPAAAYAGINHPDWTSMYPPATLAYEAGVTGVDVSLVAFKVAGMVAELTALGLILALLARRHAPGSLLLLAAWNPVGPLAFAGEGHNDAALVLLLALGAYLAEGAHWTRAVGALSLAALAKPFALPALLPALLPRSGARWWRWLLPPLLALAAWLPFAAGLPAFLHQVHDFGATLHFHGALEPWLRMAACQLMPDAPAQAVVTWTLSIAVLAGSAAITWWTRREAAPERLAQLVAWLLICLPTLHFWYLAPLVILLPMSGSRALVLWTALAPMYWLHALANHLPTDFIEIPWVTAVAHLPAMAWLLWEVTVALRDRRRSPHAGGLLAAPAT